MDSKKSAQLSMAVFEDMIITKCLVHVPKQHDPCTKMVSEMEDLTLKTETTPCDWIDWTEKLDTDK